MTTFPLDSYSIVIPKELEAYNSIRLKYEKLANSLEVSFSAAYSKNFTTMDGLHENCQKIFFTEYLSKAIDIAIQDLVNYKIFDVSESVFIDKYLSDTWSDQWGDIDEKYLNIVLSAEELDDYRSSRRQNRGKWVGGGFSLQGAIKGSLQAGAMNIAANAAHGAFNLAAKGFSMLGDVMKKEKLFNDPQTKENILSAVYMQIYCVHFAVVEAITDKSNTKIHDISTSDRASAKSILDNIQKNRVDAGNVKELLVNAIRLDPYNSSLYKCWFEKFADTNGELESIACFFGNNAITREKIGLLSAFKSSLSFSTPSNARESLIQLQNKAQQIGKPFSDADIVAEKRLILRNYMRGLDFSTSVTSEKNLPTLKAYAEAIDFLDEYQHTKMEIERTLVQKALDLKEADKFTNSTKQIIVLLATFVLFLFMLLGFLAALNSTSAQGLVFGVGFSGGIAYVCYRKIMSVKGTVATSILHSLGHIIIGVSTFFTATLFLGNIVLNDKEIDISLAIGTVISLAIGGGVGWHFYDMAATRFKEQGVTPKPQKFFIAIISGLVLSFAALGYGYTLKKEYIANKNKTASVDANVKSQNEVPVPTPTVTEKQLVTKPVVTPSHDELPFVGKRGFNIMGGSGTEQAITIEENGHTIVESFGTQQTSIDYDGAFSNPIRMSGNSGLLFKDGKVYQLTGDAINTNCSTEGECVSELTPY